MYQGGRLDLRDGEADVAGLRRRIRVLADDLRSRFGASLVLLFGSLARGDVHEGSDIDLIVVGDFAGRFHERPGLVLELTDLPVEALCYTADEFARMLADENPFILAALEEGVAV
jgi:predicted nucleotidyltransferase